MMPDWKLVLKFQWVAKESMFLAIMITHFVMRVSLQEIVRNMKCLDGNNLKKLCLALSFRGGCLVGET